MLQQSLLCQDTLSFIFTREKYKGVITYVSCGKGHTDMGHDRGDSKCRAAVWGGKSGVTRTRLSVPPASEATRVIGGRMVHKNIV